MNATTANFVIGQQITAGQGDDRDTGRVDAINGDTVTVAWDSGVVTTQPAETLVLAMAEAGV